MKMTFCTAATLRAVLLFLDPVNTPKIAYDDDTLAEPLIAKLKDAIGDKDGSQNVTLSFNEDERPLQIQFEGVCGAMSSIFSNLI